MADTLRTYEACHPLKATATSVSDFLLLGSWSGLGVGVRGLSSPFLAFEFLRQLTFEASFLPGLQKEGMLLHILDDALLLYLPLETPKGALD